MKIVVITSCIALMTSYGVAGSDPYHYYYIHDGKRVNTTEMPKSINISKLVVDFRVTVLLASFALVKASGLVIDYKRATTRYLDETRDYLSPCAHRAFFDVECVYQPASQLTVEIETSHTLYYALEAYRFDLEHFLGCFEAQTLSNVYARGTDGRSCATYCRSSRYYGTNSSHCICFEKLSKVDLVPAILDFCGDVTGTPGVWLQGIEHFAIYSRKKLAKYEPRAYPSWSCLFDYEDCPKCSKGWMGLYCNIIDCSSNNGDCGDKLCQSITIKEYVIVAVCKCQEGFLLDDDLDHCYERNASLVESDPSNIFKTLRLLVGLLFCLIIIATALLFYHIQKYL